MKVIETDGSYSVERTEAELKVGTMVAGQRRCRARARRRADTTDMSRQIVIVKRA